MEFGGPGHRESKPIHSREMIVSSPLYFPFLNLPGVAPVFCFFFADPFISGSLVRRKHTLTFFAWSVPPFTELDSFYCFLPSVWRTGTQWRWRKSPIVPACCPVGSSQFSYSRCGSCPHCRARNMWEKSQQWISNITLKYKTEIAESLAPVSNSAAQCLERALRDQNVGWSVLDQWRESSSVPELFLAAHELDQTLLVRLVPLQVHSRAVHHFRWEKQTPGLFVQPALRSGVLLQGRGKQRRH